MLAFVPVEVDGGRMPALRVSGRRMKTSRMTKVIEVTSELAGRGYG